VVRLSRILRSRDFDRCDDRCRPGAGFAAARAAALTSANLCPSVFSCAAVPARSRAFRLPVLLDVFLRLALPVLDERLIMRVRLRVRSRSSLLPRALSFRSFGLDGGCRCPRCRGRRTVLPAARRALAAATAAALGAASAALMAARSCRSGSVADEGTGARCSTGATGERRPGRPGARTARRPAGRPRWVYPT